jgi:tetratricopeptide (TPR) repeat protein
MKTTNLLKLTTIAAAIVFGAATAYAAEGMSYGAGQQNPGQGSKDVRSSTSSPAKATDVRQDIARPLKEAVDLGKKNDFQGALAKVREADAITDKNPYEEYVVANFIVNFSIKSNDHATATTAINRAMASNGAPEKELPLILSTAITLNTEAKNYKQAISAGDQLEKSGKMDAASQTNVSIAYYNSGDYPNALRASKAALAMETAGGGKPIEQTLIILKNAQIKTGDTKGALQTEVQLCDISTTEPKAQCDAARKATKS